MAKLNFFKGVALGIGLCGLVAAGSVLAASERHDATEQQNIATVLALYNAALNDKDWDEARKYLGDRYTQHNPTAKDGPEGLRGYIEFLKKTYPENHGEIKQVIADGDMVVLHVHSKRTPDSLGNAIVDIFKLENGKVVEHWDVIQPIPETSANDNTMF